MMKNLDSYVKVRAGRRQKESTSNLTGDPLPSFNPLGAFVLALKLLDCIFLINEWAVAFRVVLFSGIIQYICLWLKLQLHNSSERSCILLPIGTPCEFVIYSLCIYIYIYRWLGFFFFPKPDKLGYSAKVSFVCWEGWPAWQDRSRALLFLTDSRGCVSCRSRTKHP